MKHKILSIDDHPENNILVAHFLSNDFDVISAYNGMQGLELMNSNRIDVVLLDIMMPIMSGFEVLEKIISNPATREIPVIMVSAKTDIEDVKHSLKKGALDYIKKPIDFAELHNKISIAIKVKKQADEINKYAPYVVLHESLIHARRLQQSLLPDKKICNVIFPDSFIIDIPKDIISGDFYWMNFSSNKKFISIFDSTGHGVPGAMLSIMGHMLLNEFVLHNKETSPKRIFDFLASEINLNLNRSSDTYAMHDGMDGIFCCIDEQNNTLEYASANRPILIIRKIGEPLILDGCPAAPSFTDEKNSLYLLKGNNLSLGRESTQMNFTNHKIELQSEDVIYLFTDGITDQIGGKSIKKLAKRDLLEFLLSIQAHSMPNQKMQIYRYFDNWKEDQEQTDDILIFGIKY